MASKTEKKRNNPLQSKRVLLFSGFFFFPSPYFWYSIISLRDDARDKTKNKPPCRWFVRRGEVKNIQNKIKDRRRIKNSNLARTSNFQMSPYK